jgi:hypothetical protein
MAGWVWMAFDIFNSQWPLHLGMASLACPAPFPYYPKTCYSIGPVRAGKIVHACCTNWAALILSAKLNALPNKNGPSSVPWWVKNVSVAPNSCQNIWIAASSFSLFLALNEGKQLGKATEFCNECIMATSSWEDGSSTWCLSAMYCDTMRLLNKNTLFLSSTCRRGTLAWAPSMNQVCQRIATKTQESLAACLVVDSHHFIVHTQLL